MKRYLTLALLITGIVLVFPLLLGGAQGELPDLKRIRQELEVMENVLQTTLRLASRDLQQQERASAEIDEVNIEPFGFHHVSSLYLQAQGAIFTIPVAMRHEAMVKVFYAGEPVVLHEQALLEAEREVAEVRRELVEQQPAGILGGGVGGVVQGVPQPPPPPAVPPAQTPATPEAIAPPAKAERIERAKQRAAEIKEKIKARRREQEQRQAEFWKDVEQLKAPLVEALAKHGGSLTAVKPNEYITLILSGEGKFDFAFGGSRENQRRVLSVQKSVVADYNAGRINLEQFKAKVMDYRN